VDLTIIIPVFNEVESITPLLDEIAAQFDATGAYEVIVVDDGSSDGTPAVLQAARQSHPQLRVLRHRERYGQSMALVSGVLAARTSWIATDSACGLRIFARSTFLGLPRFDHMHRFLPALVQLQGGKVLCVEVNHRRRRRGQSKYGIHNRLWAGIVDTLGVLWLQRRSKQPVVSEIE
jgi:glycosyltransferase involved in cell wall biosynthesis